MSLSWRHLTTKTHSACWLTEQAGQGYSACVSPVATASMQDGILLQIAAALASITLHMSEAPWLASIAASVTGISTHGCACASIGLRQVAEGRLRQASQQRQPCL